MQAMPKTKIILGIETSCDETAAAVLLQENNRVTILSSIIGTSALIQAKYGGVIPEQAAREQIKSIIPVIEEALKKAHLSPADLDAIAVTQGPGLIGSLLVGVETAKTLALLWNKPLIPVSHLIGHFYANWINYSSSPLQSNNNYFEATSSVYSSSENPAISLQQDESRSTITPTFPCLGLLVSGGHSDLVLFESHGKYKYLGGTRDDAAGECFDKSARLIGYPYPGGPKISKLAEKGNPKRFKLPRPMTDSKDLDFSFSGLKTAFANLVSQNFQTSIIHPDDAQAHWKHIILENKDLNSQEQTLADLCASIEQAIIDSLVKKVIIASQTYDIDQIIVAGGVASNQKLIAELRTSLQKTSPLSKLFSPLPYLCTDNGAMIAAAAFFYNQTIEPEKLEANPNLSLSSPLEAPKV